MRRFFTWKWLGRFAILGFALMIVAPLVYRAVLRSQGQSELDRVVKALDESDPGWTLDDLYNERNAKLPPAEKNGFDAARNALAAFPREFGKETEPLYDISATSSSSPRKVPASSSRSTRPSVRCGWNARVTLRAKL